MQLWQSPEEGIMESLPLMTILTLQSDKFPKVLTQRETQPVCQDCLISCDNGTSHFLSVWQDWTLQMPLSDTKTSLEEANPFGHKSSPQGNLSDSACLKGTTRSLGDKAVTNPLIRSKLF